MDFALKETSGITPTLCVDPAAWGKKIRPAYISCKEQCGRVCGGTCGFRSLFGSPPCPTVRPSCYRQEGCFCMRYLGSPRHLPIPEL